jgi:putative DNA primase/helicase
MVAAVRDLNGKGINVHRTFLGPNGKADMSDPRAMMPGRLPDGCAVRLAPAKAIMGIAEGIETAIAASVKFKMPVWSAINATMLAKWIPPEEVEEVHVFGDNDAKFAGQAAAYALASRLAGRMGLRVQVHIPERVGTDWAD